MKKIFFTLCALCLCGTMWADTIGEDIQKDADTGLYFATVTYDNATTTTVIAIIPAQNGDTYSVANLVKNDDGTYTLPATVQVEGGEAVALQGVAASAFASALTDTSNPIHLVIPANIINLGQEAFNKCTQIEEVTVEYSETALDEAHNTNYNSFNNCSNIKTVTLDRDISIHRNNDQYAYTCFTFCKLPSIQTVNIGEHVTTLANNAFNANGTTSQLSAVYCYTTTVPTLAYKCFNYLADGCKLYVYDELVDSFKADTKEHTYGTDTFGYGWADVFGADNIVGMGEEPDEEQPEGTLRDVTTGLYFEIDADGVTSIVADASGVYNDDNLIYNAEGGYYTFPETVTDKSGTSGSVTRIGESAFQGSNISGHIYIPAFITALGKQAFYGVTTITEVTLEYSATPIKEENNANWYTSFYNCSGIKTVHMNREVSLARGDNDTNHVYRISPFSDLTSIETIYIGENVATIPYNMFHCYNTSSCKLTTVYCYATSMVPTLQYQAFGTHTGLTLYVYDEMVESFKNDTQTYSWPSFFTTIEGMGSIPLEEGTYKDKATGLYFELDEEGNASIYHDEAGVYSNANLVVYSEDEEGNATAYTLPSTVEDENGVGGNVTRVEKSAFEGSAISGHLVIPANITKMGENAFKSCTSITTVTYEYSPTALTEENATTQAGASFHDCTGLTTVNWYRNIVSAYTVNGCQQPGPFSDLGCVVTLNIGPRVTELLRYAFRKSSNATAMTTINCYAAVPPTVNTNAFGVLPSGCVVNVPSGSETAYAESSWSTEYTSLTTYSTLSNAYAVAISLNNDDGYYATYYNSKAVDIYPQGGTDYDVTSYAVSGVTVEDDDKGYLDLAEVGATVPAGTAVLVEATAEGTYTIIETTAAQSASYIGENDLYGYDTATDVTNDETYYYYTLSHPADGGTLGFYWATSDGSASSFTSAAHKAYLMLLRSEVKDLKSISLRKGDGAGDTTGITSVEVENEANTVKGIYTLQGVRVSNMNQKGVYIVDGRKVLVK